MPCIKSIETEWSLELKIEKASGSTPKFKVISYKCSHNALFQNC